MNEQLLHYFNEIEKHHWWWEGRRQILRQEIKKVKNLRILDIGCGTGETLTFLDSYLPIPKLSGVDSSQVAVNYAKKRGHSDIRKVDALNLPYQDNTFDYILLLDVIEHIKDDASLLSEAKRVLKKGGKILITSPALQFIWSDHDRDQGHFRRYTRTMIKKLANNEKLKIMRISYFNFFLSPAIIVIRLLSNLKPLKKLGAYDSDLNFNIAKKSFVNEILKFIFTTEIKIMKYVSYPIGISVFALLKK